MSIHDLIERVAGGESPRSVLREALQVEGLDPGARKKLLMGIYNAFPLGNKDLRGGKHKVMWTGSLGHKLGKTPYQSDTLEDLSDEDLLAVAQEVAPMAQSLKALIAQAQAMGLPGRRGEQMAEHSGPGIPGIGQFPRSLWDTELPGHRPFDWATPADKKLPPWRVAHPERAQDLIWRYWGKADYPDLVCEYGHDTIPHKESIWVTLRNNRDPHEWGMRIKQLATLIKSKRWPLVLKSGWIYISDDLPSHPGPEMYT
jgi:hypothetical protein